MQDLESVKHTIGQLIPVAVFYDDAGKMCFYCFKVFFENPLLWRLISRLGKKANAGFYFSLSYIQKYFILLYTNIRGVFILYSYQGSKALNTILRLCMVSVTEPW
jgi:hypothetical protein